MPTKMTSLTKKTWNIKNGEDSLNDFHELSEILLQNRNIKDIDSFLNAAIKRFMPDPFHFIDMEKAVKRIVQAIRSKEKITILGDYDVDGVSSTAIFIIFLQHLNMEYEFVIPSRFDDGYGLSIKNIEKYKDSLIIAVDCGSSSIEELQYAKENDVDIIVIDHHKMNCIPEAVAIVNPHRPDESGEYLYLCATAMVFMCITGLNRELRQSGHYKENYLKEPELLDYLDLVALATVCDVMDLIDLNRAFVMTGLKVMQKRKNLGIDALISIGKITNATSDSIAFFLGPRINAAGRLATADTSVQLLTTKNPIEARKIALYLDGLNRERQSVESQIADEATQRVDESLNFVCLYDRGWHQGVIGIVAGRLKEKYNKPTFIVSINETGIGKASCRSIEGVDIVVIIKKAAEKGILISGGGHAMAAGFSIEEAKLEEFVQFLKEEITQPTPVKELYADCFLPAELASIETARHISKLEPFGTGNIHPKFVLTNVRIMSHKVVGKNHLQISLKSETGRALNTISFKSYGTPLGDIIMNYEENVSILGTLSISEWKGREYLSFYLEDIAAA